MMDLAFSLRAFIRTVERGSMTAAARDLGISQPAVTKQVRKLEAHVGVRLLERSSRLVRTTQHGSRLYEASRSALASIDETLEGLRRDLGSVEGSLRVHAPSCIGAKHLHPIVLEFQQCHPGVSIDLVLESRVVDLVHEEIDVAIRYGRPEAQELVIRRLGTVRRVLAASPAFLARVGPIESPEALSRVPIVTTTAVTSARDTLALYKAGEVGAVSVPIRGALRTNSAEVLAATLLGGHAAGPVQHLLVAGELADGRLVRILPDYEARSTEAFFVYPSNRYMRPAVRLFTDLAVARLRAVEGIAA